MIEISEDGIVLESSAKMMAELPSQAFGISLSDSDIEEMIACIQNGDTIELSLGECPAFIFGGQEIAIPHISECVGYDLFQSDPSNPSEYLNKLPNPTMGMFTPLESSKPKPKTKKPKAPPKPKESTKANSTKPPTQLRKAASGESPTLAALPDKGDVGEDDAIANLKNSLARVEADKNTAVVVPGLLGSKGKARPSNRLLDNASPRSLPTSPALSSVRSPSLVSGTDQSRPQTFPIIHELALSELSFEDLFAKWNEGSEDEFRTALNKVADFDDELQKWTLKKKQWKELDVFEYDYATEEDRQTAIEHAVKQYDRQRVGPSDPIWQKLLPVSERGKGVCLSKLQAAFARGPAAPKPKGDSTSGSDKDESGSSSGMKGKGGEQMSRSSSQTSATGKKKLSASEAQAKRLLSSSKKPAAASTPKASPKVSPTKPQTKVPAAKAGRVLSKEFVSDSSSDDEVPLSTSLAKTKVAAAAAPSKSARETALSKAKARPASAIKTTSKEAEKEREKGTIRAEVVARPTKAATKRQRTTEDDDSSSSGTPLSKRVKAGAKAPVTAVNSTKTSSAKPRTVSDASQSGRGSVSAALTSKAKTTSPMKSSPLAASPPTNASDMEPERASRPTASEREREREREKEERERERQREVREREKERLREEREQERERQRELRDEREREKERRERERERAQTRQREREREREHSRDTVSSTSSGGDSTVSVISKKRPATDSYSEKASKKQRLSQDTLNKAFKFKQFYARYRLLHKEINDLEDPDPTKLNALCEMHELLKKMKEEIYAEVPAEA